MFVRKKRNKSGVISVQIIDKSSGKYKMIKTIGSSSDEKKIEQLVELGKDWIETNTNSLVFDFSGDRQSTEDVLNNIEQINISGTFFFWVNYLMKLDLIRLEVNFSKTL